MSLFSNKIEKQEEVQLSSSSNQIGKGTIIRGDLETMGNIRIDGHVHGNISSKSKLVLGDGSLVEGNIYSQNAEVSGEVRGKIEIKEVLILKPSAVIHGDIITAKLIIESGATFNGTCQMGENVVGSSSSKENASKKASNTVNGEKLGQAEKAQAAAQ